MTLNKIKVKIKISKILIKIKKEENRINEKCQ
jgi:hypothetical protein